MTRMSEDERRAWVEVLARRLRRPARAACRHGPAGVGDCRPEREPPAIPAREGR
jgi:hypothetical protein